MYKRIFVVMIAALAIFSACKKNPEDTQPAPSQESPAAAKTAETKAVEAKAPDANVADARTPDANAANAKAAANAADAKAPNANGDTAVPETSTGETPTGAISLGPLQCDKPVEYAHVQPASSLRLDVKACAKRQGYTHDDIANRVKNGGSEEELESDEKPLLVRAIECGDVESAKALIDIGAIHTAAYDDDVISVKKRTPLMAAAWRGNVEMIQMLRKAGQDVNAQDGGAHFTGEGKYLAERESLDVLKDDYEADRESFTPLMYAIAGMNSYEAVKALLDAGAKPDAPALRLAIRERKPDVVQLLLGAHNADNSPILRVDMDAVREAAATCNADALRLILCHSEWKDRNAHDLAQAFAAASQCDTADSAQMLAQIGAPVSLFDAVKADKPQVVEALIASGADVHARNAADENHSVLWYAAEVGNADIVRALLKAGATIDNDAAALLETAAAHAHADVLALLLEAGAKLDSCKPPILHVVAEASCHGPKWKPAYGREDFVFIDEWADPYCNIPKTIEILTKAGADPFVIDESEIPLETAIYADALDTFAPLVKAMDVDPEKKEREWIRIALAFANEDPKIWEQKEVSVLGKLLEAGVPSPMVAAELSENLLPDLIRKDDTKNAIALIQHGIDVNAVGEDGSTAFSIACEKGNYKLARFLYEKHADILVATKGKHPVVSLLSHVESGWKYHDYKMMEFVAMLLRDPKLDLSVQVSNGGAEDMTLLEFLKTIMMNEKGIKSLAIYDVLRSRDDDKNCKLTKEEIDEMKEMLETMYGEFALQFKEFSCCAKGRGTCEEEGVKITPWKLNEEEAPFAYIDPVCQTFPGLAACRGINPTYPSFAQPSVITESGCIVHIDDDDRDNDENAYACSINDMYESNGVDLGVGGPCPPSDLEDYREECAGEILEFNFYARGQYECECGECEGGGSRSDDEDNENDEE